MRLPDGTVLMHENAPYDPVKAHEYYLRTRKLHPRQIVGKTEPTGRNSAPHGFTVKTGHGSVHLSAQQLTEQKTYAAARVKHLQTRLVELNSKLRKRLEAARKREQAAKRPPTAAEKAKAARDAKQYRQKHAQELKTKAKVAAAKKAPAKPHKSETVANIKQEIVTTKASLKQAVAKQRELMAAKRNG